MRNLGISALLLGFDPRRLGTLKYVPKFRSDLHAFRGMGGQVDGLMPILSDFQEPAGSAKGHYFHQDLLVASFIHAARPDRHIDVGSRIDGFVAHVAAFRPIEVMDVRALDDTGHPNIKFMQQDLINPSDSIENLADSVSSLHAIEHFGLGRYTDPIDPSGHRKGFRNLASMVRAGGALYVGLPIGARTEVFFNAYRIFAPAEPVGWEPDKLALERFDFVDDAGNLNTNADVEGDLSHLVHGCGIYSFRRKSR